MFSPPKTFKFFSVKIISSVPFILLGIYFFLKSNILMFIIIGKFSAILSFKISFRIHLIFFIGCSCNWLDVNVLCTFISCDSELLFLPCLCMLYLEGSNSVFSVSRPLYTSQLASYTSISVSRRFCPLNF